MKVSKVLLIAQAVGMYLMHLPLYVYIFFFGTPIGESIPVEVNQGLLIAFLVLSALVFPICILNTVFPIISIFKGDYNPSKTTMIVKLALIPWYIMNYVMCGFIVAGCLNPFLMLAIPIIICIASVVTYIYMVTTSLYDVAYFIRGLIKKRIKVSAIYIVSLIFLFIFCLDIAGGILFYNASKDE